MRIRIGLLSVVIASGFLVACGSSTPASSGSTSGGSAASGGSDFGVPECDQYFKKYLACIDSKVPESARAQVRQGLDQSRAAWRQAASTPAGKAALAQGCTQATQMAQQAMKAYGCQW